MAVVPAGRARFLEILLPYLNANRHILDVCHLWRNTEDPDDIEYIYAAAAGEDAFIQVISPTIPVDGIWSIHHFFRYCCDPGTVYIRFDDDVCWIAPDALEALVRFRLENPDYFLVYANTINNSICSYIHQRLGCFGTAAGVCEYDVLGAVSHASPELAELAHKSFLNRLEGGCVDAYHFPRWIACGFERISINCICWLGSDFAEFHGEVGDYEEVWLSEERSGAEGRPTVICGEALVSHFAYHTQRAWLEGNTNLLERYRILSLSAAKSEAKVAPNGGAGV